MSKEPFPCSIISTLKSNLEIKLEEYKVALEEVRAEGTMNSVRRLRAIEAELDTIKSELEDELSKAGYSLEEENTSTLSADYKHPDGKLETITFDLEATLEDFKSFYDTHGIPVPSDFAPKIREIFNNNQTAIENEIKIHGFNKMLVVPGNLSLIDVARKMSKGKGYNLRGNFKDNRGFAGATEPPHTKKHRLVLVHDAEELSDREELKSTINIRGVDAESFNLLSLTDYLIFAKHHYIQTKKHLDTTDRTWIATKSGSNTITNLVSVGWIRDDRRLSVRTYGIAVSYGDLGVRPSAVFT